MLKILMYVLIYLTPFWGMALELGAYGERWAEIKYGSYNDDEKKELFDRWIKSAQPKDHDEQLWLYIARSTRAGLVGGLTGAQDISDFLPELEKLVAEPKSELDFVCCAMAGYLYAKIPGWPISGGSETKAHELLNIATRMGDNHNVAFYLAKGYYTLSKIPLAKQYLVKSVNGFNQEPLSTYVEGKLRELKELSNMLKEDTD